MHAGLEFARVATVDNFVVETQYSFVTHPTPSSNEEVKGCQNSNYKLWF